MVNIYMKVALMSKETNDYHAMAREMKPTDTEKTCEEAIHRSISLTLKLTPGIPAWLKL